MELAFSDKELRALCLNEFLAKQEYDEQVARTLQQRLADLASISNGAEIFFLPGSPKELNNGHQMFISMALNQSKRLILTYGGKINHLNNPGDKFDWSSIRRIKILDIVERGQTYD